MMMRNIVVVLLSLCLCTRIADASLTLAQRIKGFDMTDVKNEKSSPVVQNDPNVDTMQVIISVPQIKVVDRKKSTTKSATAPVAVSAPSASSVKHVTSVKKIHTKKSTTKSDTHKKDKVTLPPTPPPTPMPTPHPTIFVDPACSKGKGGKGGKGSKLSGSSRRDLQYGKGKGGGKGGSKSSKKCSKRGNMGGPMVPVINPNIPVVPVGVPVGIPGVVPVGFTPGGVLPIPIPPIPPPSGLRFSKKSTLVSQRGPDLLVVPAPVALPGVPATTPTQKDSKRRRLY